MFDEFMVSRRRSGRHVDAPVLTSCTVMMQYVGGMHCELA